MLLPPQVNKFLMSQYSSILKHRLILKILYNKYMKPQTLTLSDLAHMSSIAYQDSTESKYPPENWDLIGQSNKNDSDGYFGMLFKHKMSDIYVISNRGTRLTIRDSSHDIKLALLGEIKTDLSNDIQIALTGECKSAKKALEYTLKTIKNFKNYGVKDYQLYITGHSKGAFESSYVIKQLKSITKSEEIPNLIGGIGFNCPGAGLFRKKADYADEIPFLNLNRSKDTISTRVMPTIGKSLILPDNGKTHKFLQNHTITKICIMFRHYPIFGNIEINQQSIFNLKQSQLDHSIIKSRKDNIQFIENTSLDAENKEFYKEKANGVENHQHIKEKIKKLGLKP